MCTRLVGYLHETGPRSTLLLIVNQETACQKSELAHVGKQTHLGELDVLVTLLASYYQSALVQQVKTTTARAYGYCLMYADT